VSLGTCCLRAADWRGLIQCPAAAVPLAALCPAALHFYLPIIITKFLFTGDLTFSQRRI